MKRRSLALAALGIIVLLAVAFFPATIAYADSTAGDCADGTWEVRPNQTLYFIAFTCGTTVSDLIAANGIQNPNILNVGTILTIPTGTGSSGGPVPAPAGPPSTTGTSSGGVQVAMTAPVYDNFQYFATMNITVTNVSVAENVAGGKYLPPGQRPPPEPHWITLLRAAQGPIVYPILTENEPLWHAIVYTSDGLIGSAYAGCVYRESVYAEGDEPISRVDNIWFHWDITLVGGWFDCGNEYRVKPEDLKIGQSATVPLTFYTLSPRQWPYDGLPPRHPRKITRIDLELFTPSGRSLGIVASQTFTP